MCLKKEEINQKESEKGPFIFNLNLSLTLDNILSSQQALKTLQAIIDVSFVMTRSLFCNTSKRALQENLLRNDLLTCFYNKKLNNDNA